MPLYLYAYSQYTSGMDTRSKLVAYIVNEFKGRFRTFDNTGQDRKVVGGEFPDVILMRPEPPPNTDVLFLMKIETGSKNFIESFSEWRALASTPSILYVVVPKAKRDEATKLISATALRARVASYELEGDDIKSIQYE